MEVCSHKGTTKQSLPFSESEGDPFLLDVNGDFMAVATRLNVVKLFDLSRREVRPHGASHRFEGKDGFTAPGTIPSSPLCIIHFLTYIRCDLKFENKLARLPS